MWWVSIAFFFAPDMHCTVRLAFAASPRVRYNGMEGTHGSTMVVDKKEDCLVCGAAQRTVEVDPASTLADLVETL